MKIALLGGSGFIGKNLALALSTHHEVFIIDRRIDEEWFLNHGFSINQLYQSEFSNVVDILHEIKINKLIHLVSTVHPGSSMVNPEQGYSIDVIETIHILEYIKDKDISMLFFSSGGTVYGDKSDLENIPEESTLHPISHYGVVKGTIESILLMYNRVYDMKNIIVRLSNPYGEYQDANGSVGVVAVFMNKIMKDEDIIITGDGSVVRDYIHIQDVRKIIAALVEKEHTEHSIYNVGSGQGASVNQIIEMLEVILEKKANVIYKASRRFDVQRNVLDISRIQNEFNVVRVQSLEEGIKSFYQFTCQKKVEC